MFKKIYIGILMVLLIAFDAYSFDNEITHRDITQKAVENSNLNNYLINNLGFQSGVETTIDSISILKSLKEGSYLEDSPMCRASNHFHNPLLPWDQSYMSDDTTVLGSLIRTYCNLTGWSYSDRKSNVTWGTGYLSPGGSKTSISNQEYDWDDAKTYYYQALTGSLSTDRETYFTKTFQTLGQVI